MRLKHLAFTLTASLALTTVAFAEPAIQPGETLESLSKAKISTTVNGQAGSIQDLVANGQIQIIQEADSSTAVESVPSPQDNPTQVSPDAQSDQPNEHTNLKVDEAENTPNVAE